MADDPLSLCISHTPSDPEIADTVRAAVTASSGGFRAVRHSTGHGRDGGLEPEVTGAIAGAGA